MNTEITKAYQTLQKDCGIKVGDEVMVLRKAKDFEMGWETVWIPEMNEVIGNIREVMGIDPKYGFCLTVRDSSLHFPFFVLEKIEVGVERLEVTMQEIEDIFGCKVKIIKEN